MNFLESRKQEVSLKFFDINTPDLSLELEYGITYPQAIERIHAIKNYGSVIKDINLFQEAYNLIGMGWIYAPKNLTIINGLIKFTYGL